MPPKSIAQRRIEVYLPSLATKDEWTRAAAKRKLSLSEFVFEVVHASLEGHDTDLRGQIADLRKEIDALTTQNAEQRRRIETLEALNDRMEQDLAAYRAQTFSPSSPITKLDARLVRVLAEAKDKDGQRPVSDAELRKAFRLSAKADARSKAIQAQLEFLETHGQVKHSAKGWTWHGE